MRLPPFAAALALALPAHAQQVGGAFTPADLVGLDRASHVSDLHLTGDRIYFMRITLAGPAEAYAMPAGGGAPAPLTQVEADKLAGVRMSAAQSFNFAGWNGEAVHGWVFKPYGFEPGRKYPVAFLIHGGPQGSWGDDWSIAGSRRPTPAAAMRW